MNNAHGNNITYVTPDGKALNPLDSYSLTWIPYEYDGGLTFAGKYGITAGPFGLGCGIAFITAMPVFAAVGAIIGVGLLFLSSEKAMRLTNRVGQLFQKRKAKLLTANKIIIIPPNLPYITELNEAEKQAQQLRPTLRNETLRTIAKLRWSIAAAHLSLGINLSLDTTHLTNDQKSEVANTLNDIRTLISSLNSEAQHLATAVATAVAAEETSSPDTILAAEKETAKALAVISSIRQQITDGTLTKAHAMENTTLLTTYTTALTS